MAENKFGFQTIEERDRHLTEMVISLVRTAEEETLADRQRWARGYALFDGAQDWGADRKEHEWMSKVFLHEYSVIVRDAAAAAVEIVLQNPDFFNIRMANEDKTFAKIMEKLILYVVNKSGFYKKFYEFCLSGGITGIGVFKFSIQEFVEYLPEVILEKIEKLDEDKKKKLAGKVEGNNPEVAQSPEELFAGFEEIAASLTEDEQFIRDVKPKKKMVLRPTLELINPHNFFWHPDATTIEESLYLADRSFTTLAQLEPYFESHVYNKSKREQLVKSMGGRSTKGSYSAQFMGTREGQKWGQRHQTTSRNQYLKEMEVINYWGPILSKEGEIVKDNCFIVIANEQVVLKAIENPHYHQQKPYLTAIFSRKAFKAIGAGVADNAMTQQEVINDLASLFVDMLRQAVYGTKTVNTANIIDETQLEGGIKPGQIVEVAGDPEKVFGKIPYNVEVGAPLFQMMEALRLSGQKGAGVNTMTANPASRSRITATEVGLNQSRSNRSESTLAHEIDTNLLEPMLNMAKSYVLQYSMEDNALDDMRMLGVLSVEEHAIIKDIPRIERITESLREYEIEIRGFRSVLERQDHVQRMIEFLAVANQNPDILASVDKKFLLTQIADDFNIDVNKLFFQNSPFDIAKEENAMLLAERAVEVLPDDEHPAHLQVHYTIQGMNEKAIEHIQQHWMMMLQNGQMPMEPPPELIEVLGWEEFMMQIEQQQQPEGEVMQ